VLGVATPCAPRTVPWSAEAFAPAIPIRHRAERGWTVRIEDPVIADGAETSFLLVKDVALRLRRSARTIHELTRLEAIPHRKRPGIRRCLFLPDELRAWEDGRPLEVRHLRRGDRVACLSVTSRDSCPRSLLEVECPTGGKASKGRDKRCADLGLDDVIEHQHGDDE
jgi:hypothetical protein